MKQEFADAGQPGLVFVIGPRTTKWLIRFRSPGTKENVKFFLADYGEEKPALGLSDARKLAEAKLRTVAEGRDPRREDGAARYRTMTVDDAFQEFFDRYRGSARRNRPLKNSTVESNRSFFENEIRPAWGGRKVRSISRTDIVHLIDGIADGKSAGNSKRGDKPRPQTAVRVRALLSTAFNWFAKKGVVSENCFRDIDVPAPSQARDRVLTHDEIRWLWQAADAIGQPFGTHVQLLLMTAQRRNEVAAARWEEFDLDAASALWTIPSNRTKNGREQVVPLPAKVVELLRGIDRLSDPVTGELSKFVLSTTGSGPISGFSKAKQRIDEAMLAAARQEATERDQDLDAVQIPPWGLHDLRRTAATEMEGIGISPFVIGHLLNHASVTKGTVTSRHYAHYDYEKEKRGALMAWVSLLQTILEEERCNDNVVQLKR